MSNNFPFAPDSKVVQYVLSPTSWKNSLGKKYINATDI